MTDVELGGSRRQAPEGEPTWRARAREREAAAARRQPARRQPNRRPERPAPHEMTLQLDRTRAPRGRFDDGVTAGPAEGGIDADDFLSQIGDVADPGAGPGRNLDPGAGPDAGRGLGRGSDRGRGAPQPDPFADPFASEPTASGPIDRLDTGRFDPSTSRPAHGLPRPTLISPSADRGRTAVMERPLDSPDPRRVREGRKRPEVREVRHDRTSAFDRHEQAIDAWFDGSEPAVADGWIEDDSEIPVDVDLDLRLDTDADADGPGRTRRGAGRRHRDEPGRQRQGLGYKLGLLAVVGVSIWLVVTLLSPTTLVDTEDLPDDAGLAAIDAEPNARPSGFASDGSVISSGDETIRIDGAGAATGTEAPEDATSEDGENAEGADDAEAATDGETAAAGQGDPAAGGVTGSLDYRSNLEMIQGASVRNRNHDDSAHRNTPSAQLTPSNHYGPRAEYLNNPGGNPEQAFPIPAGGQFRVACEFSHFSYDDPLIYPGKPGAAHLHMFFGNTDVNAFSTYDSLINSGSSTCNGQELNRTGYWVPAMFDGQGNVRIPERIVVYYKGEGRSRGNTIPYPEGAAMVINDNLNDLPDAQGGAPGKASFVCSENFSGATGQPSETMPACDGSLYKNRYGVDDDPRVVLEVNIKFPQCWNGKDPSNIENFRPPDSSWYGSYCTGEYNQNLPNLEYFVNYPVAIGENTADWFLSSDVDPTSFGASKATGGSTIHGDWWGGWHKETNQQWVDNCVNYADGSASGCGFGYLTNGGPNGGAPYDGPALKMRPQYTGPIKVSAEQILRELCPAPNKAYSKPEDAAYCAPGTGL